jgi:cyclohexyl-isocyanide hydratase
MSVVVPAPVRALRVYKPCIAQAGESSKRSRREGCGSSQRRSFSEGRRPRFVILIYPGMSLPDFRAARTILHLMGGELHLAWKRREAVMTDKGVSIMPTTSFAECPESPDVLFIPGGAGDKPACLNDAQVLAFVADRGAKSKYVTAVCNGTLLLDAAGLGDCRKANTQAKSRYLLLSIFRGP